MPLYITTVCQSVCVIFFFFFYTELDDSGYYARQKCHRQNRHTLAAAAARLTIIATEGCISARIVGSSAMGAPLVSNPYSELLVRRARSP